jgi:hypothetical protein
MSPIHYALGSRVRFRSTGNRDWIFTGAITGYSKDKAVAFICDDGQPKSRPVDVERILGLASFSPRIEGPGAA